jgi:sigma-E factor negative regulatory protein RseC
MIEARAVVVRAEDGKVWARLIERQGGCGRCSESGGCHAPHLTEMFQSTDKLYPFDDTLGLSVGEHIRVLIEEGAPLRAALASYGLGTALVLTGAALGVWLAPTGQADPAAAVGMALGGLVSVFLLRRRARGPVWHPRIERAGMAHVARNCLDRS